jgi:hypothetical protein
MEPACIDYLIRYSGGNIRILMQYIQSACTYNQQLPLAALDAESAVKQTVRSYTTSIAESHWPKLVQLECSASQQIPNGDSDYLQMLDSLSIMEYENGDSLPSFESEAPWYAVNPVIRELNRFKTLLVENKKPDAGH